MPRFPTIVLVLGCLLITGCGPRRSNSSNDTPASVTQALRSLATALTNSGVTVCPQTDKPPQTGPVAASTLILGPCDQQHSATVEIAAYPSDSARAARLKELARPSLPWTQGWAWGKLAVVISEKTPPYEVLAVGSALRSLHASQVFEH